MDWSFLSKIFDFIPNTVKACVSIMPKADNHRFNVVFDIMAIMAAVCYSSFIVLMAHITKAEKTVESIIGSLTACWFLVLFFAVLCWVTTIFRNK